MISDLETTWSMRMGLCLNSDSVDAPQCVNIAFEIKKKRKKEKKTLRGSLAE